MREAVGPYLQLARLGFVGVDMFFVLSGFIITTLLLREEARDGRFSLRGFYWRRLLRIVPVYFFVVTVVGIFHVVIKGRPEVLESLPFYYLFLSNFVTDEIPLLGITWSLAVEEQYYLIWPLLLGVLPRRWLLPTVLGLIALNVIAIMDGLAPLGIGQVAAGPLLFRLPTATYAPILMGSALALLLDREAGFRRIAALFGHRFAPALLLGLLLVVLQTLPADLRGLPNLAMHAVMTALLASIVVREDHVLAPALQWGPAARLGEISYGVYLYHMLALLLVNTALKATGLVLPAPLVLVGYGFVAIVMAEVSFRTLERYFQQFRGRVR